MDPVKSSPDALPLTSNLRKAKRECYRALTTERLPLQQWSDQGDPFWGIVILQQGYYECPTHRQNWRQDGTAGGEDWVMKTKNTQDDNLQSAFKFPLEKLCIHHLSINILFFSSYFCHRDIERLVAKGTHWVELLVCVCMS
ncbi:hypothetical protein CDAR_434431 [Caerostris darwini]|uniref:Uncharacterized protein n=1 Tax=Caerostris darwini TaxID=1538125 RepID=A0AAV4PK48_9ARAC|nr:hypothetical protein CDAR_434431 [Caerostris darwini]